MAVVLINKKQQPMLLSLKISSIIIILAFCFVHAVAELERFEHPPKADGSLSTLVIGDWGRRGTYNQSLVALQVIIHSYFISLPTIFFHFAKKVDTNFRIMILTFYKNILTL